jgi:hypothetical protein
VVPPGRFPERLPQNVGPLLLDVREGRVVHV